MCIDLRPTVCKYDLMTPHLFASIPVVGVIPSLGLAPYTAVLAIVKLTQAIFKYFSTDNRVVQEKIHNEYERRFDNVNVKESTKLRHEAIDYFALFINNILNIATLGLFNAATIGCVIRDDRFPPHD